MTLTKPLLLSLALVLLGTLLGYAQDWTVSVPGKIQEEMIYINAPYPACHASTIEETAGGTLVAAWFGGLREKDKSVGIWLSRLENGVWSTPIEVANGNQPDGSRLPCWNPVLFQPKNGPLMLFFKVGPAPDNWWGEWMISEDEGRSWKDRQKLPNGGIGPVKNKPVQLPSGEILCPSSNEAGGPWTLHVERTNDLGKTWSTTGPLHDRGDGGAIQPSLLTYNGGRLQMIARNRNGNTGQLWLIESEDEGKNWGPLTPLELPNPNSGTDVVTLKDGRHLLIYNHTNSNNLKDGQPKGREMINLAISENGRNWKVVATLENTPMSEFSYPAIIQTKDGWVHLTYTWNRRTIKHVVLDPSAL